MRKGLRFTGLVWLLSVLVSRVSLGQDGGARASNGYESFSGGKVLVVPSSHQDIAWMDTPDSCRRFRDKYMITPALERLKQNDKFCFSVENALNFYEYVERHPDRLPDIIRYTREGRMEWGATYNQPYEGLYEGEALIREVYYGKKKLEKMIPGGHFITAWSEDVPGRSLQTAQIWSKAGIRFLQFSRFQPGVYKWFSPDGSFVTCWTPGQYYESSIPLIHAATNEQRAAVVKARLAEWAGYYKDHQLPPNFIWLNSQDFSVPPNYDGFFNQWNTDVQNRHEPLPTIGYATGTEALAALTSASGHIDSIQGEYPDLWLYIHGPAHEKAIQTARHSSRVLTAAEKFSAVAAVLQGNFKDYPQAAFDQAWQHAIYPDHGWGGVHGDITDAIYANSYAMAARVGDSILKTKLDDIVDAIQFKSIGKPIVVFNPLSWTRTDPVEATIDMEGIYDNEFQLVDAKGDPVDYQVVSSPDKGPQSTLTIAFVARDIPSIGYSTFYLIPGRAADDQKLRINITGNVVDTRFYKITLAKGGISSIFDRRLSREWILPGGLLAGEVFSMQSVGNGAGEFTAVQQPTMEGFERMNQYGMDWSLVENGPVRTVIETIHPWRNCTVRQRVIFYTMLPRIDFQADIIGFNGEHSREFRMAFPLDLDSGHVDYEVPMGIVEVGKTELPRAAGFSKADQIYNTPCREIHPREVQDWFGAWDHNGSVAISSDVAVFDWIDPTGKNSKPVLQPLLLASRRTCNESPLGNWYLQRGDHHFTFSFCSGQGHPNWKAGKQAAQPLVVVDNIPDNRSRHAGVQAVLPESLSFAGTDADNIVISTIKKNDDLDKIVLRCYDLEGKASDIRLDWFRGVRGLEKTNILEQQPQPVAPQQGGQRVHVGRYAIETVEFDPGFKTN